MNGLKITVRLLVIAVLTGIGYSQTQWVWRVMPYSTFASRSVPGENFFLCDNNG